MAEGGVASQALVRLVATDFFGYLRPSRCGLRVWLRHAGSREGMAETERPEDQPIDLPSPTPDSAKVPAARHQTGIWREEQMFPLMELGPRVLGLDPTTRLMPAEVVLLVLHAVCGTQTHCYSAKWT